MASATLHDHLTAEKVIEMQNKMRREMHALLTAGVVVDAGNANGPGNANGLGPYPPSYPGASGVGVEVNIPAIPARPEPWEQEGASIRPEAMLDAALMVLNTRIRTEKTRQQEYLADVEKYRRSLESAERTLATHKIYIRQLEAGLELLKINEGIIKQGGG